jgi:hypothetical protein
MFMGEVETGNDVVDRDSVTKSMKSFWFESFHVMTLCYLLFFVGLERV